MQTGLADDPLIQSLAAVVRQEKLTEKILLVDTLQSGRNLMSRLTRSGGVWANLFCETPASYARKLAVGECAARGLQPADSTMTLLLVSEMIAAIPEAHSFFGAVGESPGVLRAAHRSVSQLREHGVLADRLTVGAFLDPRKAEALIALLRAYEKALRERKWVDRAEMLRMGAERLAALEGAKPLFLMPAGLLEHAYGLQQNFLSALPHTRIQVIDPGPSCGLGIRAEGEKPGPASPAQLSLFSAAGLSAEVNEVFRRTLDAGVPLEDVMVLTGGDEAYLLALECAAGRLKVPITCSSGWPISATQPGRAVKAYLRWVREDFVVRTLSDALAAGDLAFPDTGGPSPLSGTACARLLRNAGIGWGRERYLPALRTQAAEVAENPESEDDEALARPGTRLSERRQRIEAAMAWVGRLLELAPAPDDEGRVSYAALCHAAGEVALKFGAVSSPDDAAARKAIVETMGVAERWAAGEFVTADAVDRTLALIAGIRVGASGPRPGAVHVTSFDSGWAVGRPKAFLIGLDENAIPTRPAGDPLLLDEERAKINPRLPLGRELKNDDLRRLNWALGRLRGSVTLSYSVRCPGSDRASFPSPLLLTAYRLLNSPTASYDDMLRSLGRPAGYFPDSGALKLSKDEAWLARIGTDAIWADAVASSLAAYPHLERGRRMREGRESDDFTEFDGKIDPEPDTFDPRRNPALAMSASRLESLAKCPLGYFYRYMLHIRPLEEPVRDPGIWLDAMARGDVLHEVFRAFYERLGRRPTGLPSEETLIREICRDTLDQRRREVPPPSQGVFARDEQDVIASALCFLSLERRGDPAAVPSYFEVPFGFGPESGKAGGLGCAEAIAIPLSDGTSVWLKGRIDRIDRVGPHEYHIWDYKTGRPFAEGGTVVRGRRLQHALYVVAAETLLRSMGGDPAARVTQSGYLFPTVRGEARPVWVAETDPAGPMDQALRRLLDLVASGAFPAVDDPEGGRLCEYCDYAAACSDSPSTAVRRKMEAGDPALAPLKEVGGID